MSKPTWSNTCGCSATSAFFVLGRAGRVQSLWRGSPMEKLDPSVAQQIAQAAIAFQQQRTGHEPQSVAVVLSGDTLLITLHGALSPAEKALAQSPEGAAQVQEFHRQLFTNSADELRQEIKRITGVEVREATAEIETRRAPWCRCSRPARWCRCSCSPRACLRTVGTGIRDLRPRPVRKTLTVRRPFVCAKGRSINSVERNLKRLPSRDRHSRLCLANNGGLPREDLEEMVDVPLSMNAGRAMFANRVQLLVKENLTCCDLL